MTQGCGRGRWNPASPKANPHWARMYAAKRRALDVAILRGGRKSPRRGRGQPAASYGPGNHYRGRDANRDRPRLRPADCQKSIIGLRYGYDQA